MAPEPAGLTAVAPDRRGRPRTAKELARGPAEVVVHGDDGTPARRPNAQARRPLRVAAAIVTVALVAGFLSARHPHPRSSQASATSVGGTLVYASAGRDGATARLWRVSLSAGRAIRGPRTVLPDQIVGSGPGERWVGVRAGGAAYVFRDLTTNGTPQLLAEGQLAAWAPGGNAVFVVTREAPVRGRCPLLRLSFVDSLSHGRADLYEEPSCSTADGLGVDGLTRPFLSLDGPTDRGVYELGYKQLHRIVPRYRLLSVSPVGDMLVGPRLDTPTDLRLPAVTRTLLVWRGVGGPTVIGDAHNDLFAERFLAWSRDGHWAAVLGTMAGIRSVWMFEANVGSGRVAPVRAAPALRASAWVGATFAGRTLLTTADGRLFASKGRDYREVDLPPGAPPPAGPLLWLDR